MFAVQSLLFHRADNNTLVCGVLNAIDDKTKEDQIVFFVNGLNWTLPYDEFFGSYTTENGERPLFMPLATNGQPYAFKSRDRYWDPTVDKGMALSQLQTLQVERRRQPTT